MNGFLDGNKLFDRNHRIKVVNCLSNIKAVGEEGGTACSVGRTRPGIQHN